MGLHGGIFYIGLRRWVYEQAVHGAEASEHDEVYIADRVHGYLLSAREVCMRPRRRTAPKREEHDMALTINHFSIRTDDLDACRRFYADVLGLTVGPRPAFPFPGLWMYRGDHGDVANAVVHIIGTDRTVEQGLDGYLGERDETKLRGTGAIDHVAFFADGLATMLDHLRPSGVAVPPAHGPEHRAASGVPRRSERRRDRAQLSRRPRSPRPPPERSVDGPHPRRRRLARRPPGRQPARARRTRRPRAREGGRLARRSRRRHRHARAR